MTEREALKLALDFISRLKFADAEPEPERVMEAIKEALREHAMYEVQRLGQEIQPEQEPVALPCCGYTDASAIKWNPYNQVVQCHNCGQVYTTPPQRTWVGLTDEEIDQGLVRSDYAFKTAEAWRAGVVFAMTKLKEKNT